MTTALERPRWDRKNEPFSEYQKRLESYVAQYRNQRSKPRVIERIETIREVVTERDYLDASARIEKLERDAKENADLLAYLMAPAAEEVEEYRFPAPDERLSDWGAVGEDITTDDLLGESDEVAADVISKLSRDKRRRFTELLNVEMAELQLSRGGPKEDRKREAKIERLLGIFARAGEM